MRNPMIRVDPVFLQEIDRIRRIFNNKILKGSSINQDGNSPISRPVFTRILLKRIQKDKIFEDLEVRFKGFKIKI